MSSRIRWAQCDTAKFGVPSLARLMLAVPYTEDGNNWGFAVDLHDGPRLEGRFLERIQTTEIVKSPLGTEVSINSLEYRVTRFRIDEKWPAIELIAPPRTTSTFTNWLWSASDNELTPGEGALDLTKLLKSLETRVDAKVEVFEMTIRGISLPGQVVAKIAAAGAGDVRPSLSRYLNPPALVEALGFRLTPKDGLPTTARVSRSGLLRLTSVGSDIVPTLRSAAFTALVDAPA